MNNEIHISVQLLERACQVLLDHVARAEASVIAIEHDFFWAIQRDQLYDVFKEPTEHTIGQLSECVANIESINEDPSRSTTYALVWLADLMRAVGHTAVR